MVVGMWNVDQNKLLYLSNFIELLCQVSRAKETSKCPTEDLLSLCDVQIIDKRSNDKGFLARSCADRGQIYTVV